MVIYSMTWDLDTKANECLKLRSNTLGPWPTTVFLPSLHAKTTKQQNNEEEKLHTFNLLEKLTSVQQKTIEVFWQTFGDVLLWICTQCYQWYCGNLFEITTFSWKETALWKVSINEESRKEIIVAKMSENREHEQFSLLLLIEFDFRYEYLRFFFISWQAIFVKNTEENILVSN